MSGAYLQAGRMCDLVMKGGITSGIVYPPAIDHIAKTFWLNGIGGTSAGAIAASLCAAAELSRRNGSELGYQQLRNIPDELTAPGKLLSLFKSDASTESLYDLFLEATRKPGGFAKVGLFLKALKLIMFDEPLKKFVDNDFGLCTGMADGNLEDRDPPPLTQWLSDKIDELAGKSASDAPLTFGDLWKAKAPPGFESAMGDRSIDLLMVSTCVTFGKPYTLPFLDNRFVFSPTEFARLFPKKVVDYMVKVANAIPRDPKAKKLPGDLLLFPSGELMPVIVATRMSLSFPALFTLVPLYYMNFRSNDGEAVKPGDEFQKVDRVWFSDGGITSNLPIHFFDSPFPRWPTLAINLQYAEPKGKYGRQHVEKDGTWMAATNGDGRLELFHRFGLTGKPLSKILGFLMSIFRAAQVWHDNSFLTLPGYCGRVVEVWLEPDEGGMNLEMPADVVKRLAAKGDAAGQRIVERFKDGTSLDPMAWRGHRWTRYRSAMSALASYLRKMERGANHPVAGDPSIISDLTSSPPIKLGYPLDTRGASPTQLQACQQATTDLLQLINGLGQGANCPAPSAADEHPFWGGPRPHVELAARAGHTPDA